MFPEKIDIRPIIADQAATLRDHGTGKISVADIALFFILPIAIAAFSTWARVRIRASAVSAILTASAIFVGLLPSLLVLVLTFLMSTKGEQSDPSLQLRKRFMREIATHVNFCIVLSLALASVAAIALILLDRDDLPVGPVLAFLLIATSVALLLALLMLFRRMHVLVATEFDRHKFKNVA
jgi:hypothetical protein